MAPPIGGRSPRSRGNGLGYSGRRPFEAQGSLRRSDAAMHRRSRPPLMCPLHGDHEDTMLIVRRGMGLAGMLSQPDRLLSDRHSHRRRDRRRPQPGGACSRRLLLETRWRGRFHQRTQDLQQRAGVGLACSRRRGLGGRGELVAGRPAPAGGQAEMGVITKRVSERCRKRVKPINRWRSPRLWPFISIASIAGRDLLAGVQGLPRCPHCYGHKILAASADDSGTQPPWLA